MPAHIARTSFCPARYTEKSGLYVNSEGRVQLAGRATFPPGDAKEDWAHLKGASPMSRASNCRTMISSRRPRAVIADAPHFATRDRPGTARRRSRDWNAIVRWTSTRASRSRRRSSTFI